MSGFWWFADESDESSEGATKQVPATPAGSPGLTLICTEAIHPGGHAAAMFQRATVLSSLVSGMDANL